MRNKARAWGVRAVLAAAFGAAWLLAPAAQQSSQPAWRWYKGNLHTHTINSDGDSSPDFVARWYKEHRYQFLVLTDHNFMTQPEPLNGVFGAEERFLLISGEEVTSRYDSKPVHVNAFDIRATIAPVFGGSVLETIQKNVDTIRGAGGMPSLNHPNFGWAVTPDELKQVTGLKLFEVYNGHPTVHNVGGGGVPGLEEMWDVVLTAGREIYGIAVDDAHRFQVFGPEHSNPGRGWVQVKAAQLTRPAITEAIGRGDFYASTGVELEDVTKLDNGLRIRIKQTSTFKYTTHFVGAGGKILATAIDQTAEYRLKPGERYVRARVTDSMGNMAWVQPVFAR
jgi:hypothetical protein